MLTASKAFDPSRWSHRPLWELGLAAMDTAQVNANVVTHPRINKKDTDCIQLKRNLSLWNQVVPRTVPQYDDPTGLAHDSNHRDNKTGHKTCVRNKI